MKMGRGKNDEKRGKQVTEEDHTLVMSGNHLQAELIENIFYRLQVKSLIRFKCISKHFVTTDSTFIQKCLNRTLQNDDNNTFILQLGFGYLEKFYFVPNGAFEKAVKINPPEGVQHLEMVGSSNGLICLYQLDHQGHCSTIYLWNPAIRECKLLPCPHIRTLRHLPYVSLAFSFVSTTNDYKVVRLVRQQVLADENEPMYGSEVEVYSLSTNSWRKLGFFPYVILGMSSRAIMNGVIHWRAGRGASVLDGKYEILLAFNTSAEVFRELPVNDNVFPMEVRVTCWDLRVFRGCLHMFVNTAKKDNDGWITRENIDVWIMKEYGVKKSWTKLSNLSYDRSVILSPIEFMKNGELLLNVYNRKFVSKSLGSYNMESRQLKELEIPGGGKQIMKLEAIPYVETMVPVTDSR